jgi:hypothetical protein
MNTLMEYHFDVGNSNEGPLGLCAVVQATSQEEALAILRDSLPEIIEVRCADRRVVYLHVYTNELHIGIGDIDAINKETAT